MTRNDKVVGEGHGEAHVARATPRRRRGGRPIGRGRARPSGRRDAARDTASSLHHGSDPPSALHLHADDGSLAFVLQRAGRVLLVRALHRSRPQRHVEHLMLFDSPEGFGRWCALQSSRFEHPLLNHRLRRAWDELVASKR